MSSSALCDAMKDVMKLLSDVSDGLSATSSYFIQLGHVEGHA